MLNSLFNLVCLLFQTAGLEPSPENKQQKNTIGEKKKIRLCKDWTSVILIHQFWKEAQCHNTIYHHNIPRIVVENTIPHYSWQSVSDNAPTNWNLLFEKKKKKSQFIIMLDENAVSECGTKPVCISGILLCFYWQVLWLKFASVTVYYPVHTRGCENLE